MSEGRAALSPILEFSAYYEARETVDIDGQALSLEVSVHQRKQWPTGLLSFHREGCAESHKKAKQKPATGRYIKNRSVCLKINQ